MNSDIYSIPICHGCGKGDQEIMHAIGWPDVIKVKSWTTWCIPPERRCLRMLSKRSDLKIEWKLMHRSNLGNDFHYSRRTGTV